MRSKYFAMKTIAGDLWQKLEGKYMKSIENISI